MAGGPADDPPSLGSVPTVPTELTALRDRQSATDAALTQTRADLAKADEAAAARNAAASAIHPRVDGATPTSARGGGGTPAGGVPTDPPAGGNRPTGTEIRAPASDGDAPLGADGVDDYINPDDGAGGNEDDGGWAPSRGGRVGGLRGRTARLNDVEAGAYDDGFDYRADFAPTEWLQSFDIPRAVQRDDGLPMPFTPADPVHTATFSIGSREEIEARHWYCSLAWTQQVFNDVLTARFATDNTVGHLEELIEYLVGATRRIYALGVSRYDYVALRQSEPGLADAFAHADAVPRNSLRGDDARRFISRVVSAETAARAKVGAAERGYSYPNRTARGTAPNACARGSGGGGSSNGGGGGGAGSDGHGGSGHGGRGGGAGPARRSGRGGGSGRNRSPARA